jgi:hypothetical protein
MTELFIFVLGGLVGFLAMAMVSAFREREQ